MTNRILSFADGFTSATAPSGIGVQQESYLISNNQTNQALFAFDKNITKTIFADYELIRATSTGYFKQDGSMVFRCVNNAWTYTFGNYSGDEIFVDAIVNPENVVININSSTGVVTCDSGNMTGTGYIGTFKLSMVRFI